MCSYIWSEMFAGRERKEFWLGLDDQLNEGDFRSSHMPLLILTPLCTHAALTPLCTHAALLTIIIGGHTMSHGPSTPTTHQI
jgi:hypothetical protein